MRIAQITDGTITAVQSLQRQPVYDGQRWWDLRDDTVLAEWKAAHGWVDITEIPRPTDPATDWTVDVQLVNEVPTEVWAPVPWSAEAVAAQTEQANAVTVETKLATKLTQLQGILDQTNADLRADPSQEIKDIARTVRLLVRLATRQLDGR